MSSLTEAIERKYSQANHDIQDANGDFVILLPKSTARDCVPTALVLDKCNVNSAGEVEQLQRLCCNILEFDLSHNDLSDWIEIEKILRHAPLVKFLNLSFNDLSAALDDDELFSFPSALSNLQSLILIGTNITWSSVWKLLSIASNLEELHLSLNKFHVVELPTQNQKFPSLRKLTFDGNFVDDWKHISSLGKAFPNLTQLSVSNCPLRLLDEIHIHEDFLSLEVLNLSETKISSHEEIYRLNDFKALKELRLSGISFLNEIVDKEKRQELVALLPKIRKLNGGAEIGVDERDASERYFVRKYQHLDDEKKPVGFAELFQKHGELDPLVEINLKPAKKVTLKVKFGQMEMVKVINLHQTVRELKKLLEPEIGVQASRMQLYHLDVGLNFGREVLRFPDKKLYTYKVNDGDEIHVELKNNTAREIGQS